LPDRIFVIVNPRAGKGRGARVAGPVTAALGAAGVQVERAFTTRPGDEATLAEDALRRGFRTLVAVGGDGTWSHVGDAIVRSGEPARLGLVAGGTGCDFAKSLGIPAQDPSAAARVVLAGHVRRVDVGRIGARHFLNIAGFGYDVAVLEDSWRVRFLSGAPLYVWCALRQIGSFPGLRVEISVDDGPPRPLDLLMLILANARFFGGAFHIAPQADLGDGRLDAVAFRNVPPRRRLPLMARLMRGTHAGAAEVELTRAARFRLRFDEPPAFETDGEWHRAPEKELTVESLPQALAVLAPEGS
jgi:diacylglycerol kinase (ATP)